MKKIDTVLFDASGTIINDLNVTWKAISKTLNHYNKNSLSLKEFRQDFCAPYWDFFIKNGLDRETSKNETPSIFKSFYVESNTRLFSDVISTLEFLKSRKIKIGLVSQTPRILINSVLDRFSISSYFDVIVALEDCKSQKPFPGPLLRALDLVNSKKDRAVYVGDMKEDIMAAKKAGIVSIAVCRNCSYHDRNTMLRENPNFIINNFAELSKIVESLEKPEILLSSPKRR